MHHDLETAARLDLSGLNCPVPVLRCKAALHRLHPDGQLLITTDNLDATRDILLLIRRSEVQFLGLHCDARGCHFKIRSTRRPTTPHLARKARTAGRVDAVRQWLKSRTPIAAG